MLEQSAVPWSRLARLGGREEARTTLGWEGGARRKVEGGTAKPTEIPHLPLGQQRLVGSQSASKQSAAAVGHNLIGALAEQTALSRLTQQEREMGKMRGRMNSLVR